MSKSILSNKNGSLINEMKVQLEWCMADVMKNYPSLTMAEAEEVLERFYHYRLIMQREGWSVIKRFTNKVLYQKYQNKIQSFKL